MMKRPNVVFIMVDNQSAETLGCYGNGEVQSPNIDRLAAEGMRFDEAYCPNALCSPSRASALTGLLPSQHGVHSWLDDRLVGEWPAGWNAIQEFHTLPGVLHDASYATALIGKYHLGVPDRAHHGFDHWVAMKRGHTLSFYDSAVFDQGRERVVPGHSVDFQTEQALRYLAERAAEPERPFFLFLGYNGPYGHWPALQGRDDNRFAALYDDCPAGSIPRRGLSQATIDFVTLQKQFAPRGKGGPDFDTLLKAPNDIATMRNYFSQISLIDDGVGRVTDALSAFGLARDTLLIYTADHGFSLGHHGFWGHAVATWPANGHRIGYQIPMIWRQPGRIGSGGRCSRLVSSVDLYATLLSYLDLADAPRNAGSPSRDFSGLLDHPGADWDDAVFIDQEETRAIRTREALYLRRFSGSAAYEMTDAFYRLDSDPGEHHPLAGSEADAGALRHRLDAFFALHTTPDYDLWRAGAPKSNSSRPWLWRDAWGAGWHPRLGSELA